MKLGLKNISIAAIIGFDMFKRSAGLIICGSNNMQGWAAAWHAKQASFFRRADNSLHFLVCIQNCT